MNRDTPHLVLQLALIAALTSCATPIVRVSLNTLASNPQQFMGDTVAVHGCIVYATDGGGLGPCEIDGNGGFIIVSGSSFKYMAPITAGYKRNPKGSVICAAADFIGIIVEIPSPWHKNEKLPAIYLKSFSNAVLCPA